ncbi:MAG: sulfatase [Chitinophagales bacterium]
MKYFYFSILLAFLFVCTSMQKTDFKSSTTAKTTFENTGKKNVIFILSDDHRYDFMGFTGKVPFLETPNMDRMAREGAHIQNAFVSTSLCSPSRASILTGQYTHHHAVVDNQSLVPDSAVFFPKYLQKGGYETAYIGKWHMGEHHDDPRPGFDYWASFKGQGNYFNPSMNVNGERVEYTDSSYVTDVLTKYAVEFLDNRPKEKPFFMYLSHKAVHSDFEPAPRHKDKYANEKIDYPPTMFPPEHERATVDTSEYNYKDVPNWVKAQRYSWHGVDYMYHGQIKFDDFYKHYCETLLALDESIGEVLDYLEKNDLMENTVVFYMGDNGFSFGEHGLIDKRQAYEESMRVPLLVMGEGLIPATSKVEEVIQNIDIAPTILDLAGLETPANMDGASFVPLLKGEDMDWKDTIYYEYFWERPFPQTPTVHAIRTNQYKYIRYHGIWDINELYDLKNDPQEMNNLIRNPEYTKLSEELRDKLFDWIEGTGGGQMLLKRDKGRRFDYQYHGTY